MNFWIVNRHCQLITQSNDHCLLSHAEMLAKFERYWDLLEYTRTPDNPLYLRENGQAFRWDYPWKSHFSYPGNVPSYIQKVQLHHIYKKGYILDHTYLLFSRNRNLFERFIGLENREELDSFVERNLDFGFFPNKREMATLRKRYQEEAHINQPPVNSPATAEYGKAPEYDVEKIREINLDLLWEKQRWFRRIVNDYIDEKMDLQELSTLYRYMAQTNEIFFDQDDFAIEYVKKSADRDEIDDKRSFEDVLGRKKVSDTTALVPGYRVYGFFALCCLEFFQLVRQKLAMGHCAICGKYFIKNHGNTKVCSNRCVLKATAKRSAKYRKNRH